MQLMNSNNIRRLVVDTNNKLVGIITEKDIFRQIAKSPSMVTDFVGEKYALEHREVYESLLIIFSICFQNYDHLKSSN